MPKKLTIEEMQKLAAKRGGFCLSEQYVGYPKKLFWQCKNGHQWNSTSYNIKAEHWCPYCAGKMPSTIEAANKAAALHGGECLSEQYINQDTKLLWRCENGHKWSATPKHILKGVVWCPYCARKISGDKIRYTIDEMQKFATERGGFCLSKINTIGRSKFLWQCQNGHKWVATPTMMKQRDTFCVRCAGYAPTLDDLQAIAISRGGRCLSKKYINATIKLHWQCKEGHRWRAALSMIKQGTWCPYCSNHVKLTIEEMEELAAENGGHCLSRKYINSQTKLRWECKDGHVFEASPSHIKTSKSWCPICGYKIVSEKGKYSMDEIRGLAAKKGGECLSKEYSAGDKVLWRCKEGHEWEAPPCRLKNSGAWCPSCTEYVNESLIRALFEKIFGVKFMKCRPKWLIGSSGRVLELDGYNKDLGIAFEYHGEQHFKEDNYFHRTNIKTNIHKRRMDDEIKRKLCYKEGVKLIEIPFTIKQKDYFNYVVEQCKQKGVKIDSNINIDYRDLSVPMKSKLQGMKDIAAEKGGYCISTAYLGNAEKLSWRCKYGHIWKATPQVIKKIKGIWCPECRNQNGNLRKYKLVPNPNQQSLL